MAHRATKPTETENYALQLGERGRVVLPAPVRKRLKLSPGDRLVLIVDESGEMRLASLKRQIEKVWACSPIFSRTGWLRKS